MIFKNRCTGILLVSLLAIGLQMEAWASPEQVDALVKKVREEALMDAAHDQERVERFLSEQAAQRKLLQDAKAQLAAENKRADTLRKSYEDNEKTLTEYEIELRERAGDLNDLFAIVRQAALNANGILDTSLVAAEHQDRSTFLSDLGKGETPPSIEDIKELWTTVLTEISESGKVVRFNATVIKPAGSEGVQQVTRAGVFNAVSDGKFLSYLPDSGKLVELSRQPAARLQRLARGLEAADSGYQPMAVDPSKGAILKVMVQSPDLAERLQQGGGIGYLILLLGALGILIVIRRAIGLMFARRGIEAQAKARDVNLKNALGRLKQIAAEMKSTNLDAMGLRMDEQLAAESSLLNRGLPTVAVLAAVSPLLGLLGTVTGMIETFQSITLFGTGDPKLMSGGISEALITTQLGLSVAIPLVLFHSLLAGRANRLVEQLGKFSSDLVTGRELG
ncbi:MAG: MotA/TolQ/ExbB proton channel family protein [Gammaproteobacteria bacterium]|nr:MotA/TolQ/ExbB proton channel family protein [Gammaproteobacteria bacterium]MDH4314137.1 MotA/TolQ/ExbB proton channel family protein [Gammaproteobacteria bacterium]MDH5212777.1 MotA/TolQ/ExbB proton channel family protein [Gammaproteobacteria bacterium]MDH5501278.1 MotA/TolQ/ExbB proton channel family protein [Gammaproteobacteria bacterium]